MQTEQFLKELESAFLAEFPESLVYVKKSNRLYHSIYVIGHLGKKEDWANGIRQNDLMHCMLQIDLITGEFPKDHNNTDSLMPENLRLNFESSSFRVKPINPHEYCHHKKAGGRMTKGDSVKILTTVKKYFKSFKAQLIESLQAGEIMEKDQPLVIEKLGL